MDRDFYLGVALALTSNLSYTFVDALVQQLENLQHYPASQIVFVRMVFSFLSLVILAYIRDLQGRSIAPRCALLGDHTRTCRLARTQRSPVLLVDPGGFLSFRGTFRNSGFRILAIGGWCHNVQSEADPYSFAVLCLPR